LAATGAFVALVRAAGLADDGRLPAAAGVVSARFADTVLTRGEVTTAMAILQLSLNKINSICR
jgi:hypothetical protein